MSMTTNQDGRDDRVADQRDPVARGVCVLQRRLQDVLAGLREHAGLLEDGCDFGATRGLVGGLADRRGRLRDLRGLARLRRLARRCRRAAASARGAERLGIECPSHRVQVGFLLGQRSLQRVETPCLLVYLPLQRAEAVGGWVRRCSALRRSVPAGDGQGRHAEHADVRPAVSLVHAILHGREGGRAPDVMTTRRRWIFRGRVFSVGQRVRAGTRVYPPLD
jgi:hypothetical protein